MTVSDGIEGVPNFGIKHKGTEVEKDRPAAINKTRIDYKNQHNSSQSPITVSQFEAEDELNIDSEISPLMRAVS